MNKWLSILLISVAGFISNATQAGQLAGVSIINQTTGEHLPIWRHQGNNYVAGKPGERYAVEISNKTGARILSVLSVDGVNVLNGATASPSQSGYVLGAWQPVEVKGWRKTMDEVAAFYFTQLPDSYAARTGRPDNVGVIGVALFKEYEEPVAIMRRETERAERYSPPYPAAPIASTTQAQSAPAAEAGSLAKSKSSMAETMANDMTNNMADSMARKSADARIGTGHGERISSTVRNTDFHRASQSPDEIISIQYDTYAHLVARGIIPRRTSEPNPFPGSFVPDPN